MIDKAKLNAHK
ncbi:Protein of unknown function [Bacillus wiedmannii]|uniref:Uncharacterized protein n=1 Tax=Bacillus wiedmannii TaxID=1890302 RepID=A0AB37YQ55_9BACI|nr:Protein of unknown function [Bacillus wiedmannii]